MDNPAIAKALFELAEVARAAGENTFKVAAYRKAANTIREYPESVAEMPDPTVIEGIGSGIAKKIQQLITEGKIQKTQELAQNVPYLELLQITGIGPATAKTLHESFNINTINELAELVVSGKVLDGRVIRGLKIHQLGGKDRMTWDEAQDLVQPLLTTMKASLPGVKLEVCGSYRREAESIGDLDLLCAYPQAKGEAIKSFKSHLEVLMGEGPTKVSGIYQGRQIDLRIIEPVSWGAGLLYFTGSKDFNIAMRKDFCIPKGFLLNEYALYRGSHVVARETEEEIFSALGLPLIPPRLRGTTHYLYHPDEMEPGL